MKFKKKGRQCSRKTCKKYKIVGSTLKIDIYINFDKSIFGKKSYSYLAGLKQHIGLSFGKHSFRSNSSNQEMWIWSTDRDLKEAGYLAL